MNFYVLVLWSEYLLYDKGLGIVTSGASAAADACKPIKFDRL